jgi:phage tail sheath protein FI
MTPASGPSRANPRGADLCLPPSGLLAGIFARVDRERGVHAAPANEVVLSASRFERAVTAADSAVLNPVGVNCLRAITGRGLRVWGARTTSLDPEWRYVNVRRYVLFLQRSLDQGLKWAVFEPNDEPLWARVRLAIGNFLLGEWRRGALRGAKAEEAFVVRCDRSTMTQNDLAAGRIIATVGVALMKPAEFVVIRWIQKAAQ